MIKGVTQTPGSTDSAMARPLQWRRALRHSRLQAQRLRTALAPGPGVLSAGNRLFAAGTEDLCATQRIIHAGRGRRRTRLTAARSLDSSWRTRVPSGTSSPLMCWRRRVARGLDRFLLRAAEDRLRAAGSRAVGLETAVDNLSALSFYKRHGYNVVKTWPRYYSNGVDALVLRKELR